VIAVVFAILNADITTVNVALVTLGKYRVLLGR
jgi:hypothetical protein